MKFLDMQRQREHEIEWQKFFTGYIMAEMWNSAGKALKKGHDRKPMDFWIEDTQADEVDLIELMKRPELEYRFNKDG